MRLIYLCLVVLLAINRPTAADTATAESPAPLPISGADVAIAKDAFEAIEQKSWKRAKSAIARTGNPLVGKVIRWAILREPGKHASFADRADFVDRNPTWPDLKTVQRHAEETLPVTVGADIVAAWYGTHAPLTGVGQQRYGEALISLGDSAAGIEVLRETWRQKAFTAAQEKHFLGRHRPLITADDHIARLDRMIWIGQRYAATRMLKRVERPYALLGEARLRLMQRRPGVDAAIAKVPAELRGDAGLWFERVRWRRRKGFDDRARQLLLDAPESIREAVRVWPEQRTQLRIALGQGHITDAYRLAAHHHQSKSATLSEAEWLAGWIAYRFLNDPDLAVDHFKRMYGVVRYPISVARAAYWVARTEGARGNLHEAMHWYRLAAEHPTTFYGQLAARAAGKPGLVVATGPTPNSEIRTAFESRELVQATRAIAAIGKDRLARRFVRHMARDAASAEEHALIAALGLAYSMPHISIAAAKKAALEGTVLAAYSYPTPYRAQDLAGLPAAPEMALILAVARQESEMNNSAVSRAGARGLMQLRPSTAKAVARSLRIKYDRGRLTTDPLYNLRLGASYLAGLLDRYNGSYAMALAAYNAGPTRVYQWVQTFGDPRSSAVDPIDWIEMLPFEETRNYIQRVLESTEVYRYVLSDQVQPLRQSLVETITGPNGAQITN